MLFAASKKYHSPERQPTHRPRNFDKKEPVVQDLREKLNRKRQEKAHISEVGGSNPPPPDPAYNFLRDPLRGDESFSSVPEKKLGRRNQNANSEVKHEAKSGISAESSGSKRVERSSQENYAAKYNKKGGPGKVWQKQNWRSQSFPDRQQAGDCKDTINHLTKQPINIMVEVSCTSGERKCTLDATKTLQISTQKQNESVKPHFRKHPQREAQKYYVNKNKLSSTVPVNENRNQQQISIASINKTDNQSHKGNDNGQKTIISNKEGDCDQKSVDSISNNERKQNHNENENKQSSVVSANEDINEKYGTAVNEKENECKSDTAIDENRDKQKSNDNKICQKSFDCATEEENKQAAVSTNEKEIEKQNLDKEESKEKCDRSTNEDEDNSVDSTNEDNKVNAQCT